MVSNSIMVTMNQDHAIQAVFTATPHTLTITAGTGGTTSPAAGSISEANGTQVSIAATPNIGYKFDHWTVDGANGGSTNPLVIIMTADHAVQPVFVPNTILMFVAAGPNGTVSPSGSQTMTVGQSYEFVATPSAEYQFDHWDLNGTNISTTSVLSVIAASTMNGETLTAFFVQTQITLNIVAGANGNVSPIGAQILNIGSSYSFAALPSPGYQFGHWDLGGANQGSTNPISLVALLAMDKMVLTAIFTVVPPQQITLNIATDGQGTVNLANGAHTFNVGDSVVFTAIAAAQYAFNHWTLGVAIYQVNPLSLKITSAMDGETLMAVFIETTVTINVVAGSNGSVIPTGSAQLNIGQAYLFAATPNEGYSFDHWDLNGLNKGSSNPFTLTATADLNGQVLTALFTVLPPQTITFTLASSAGGSTDVAPGAHTFNIGDTVTINAIPANKNNFSNWTIGNTVYSTANPLQLTIIGDLNGITLTANFTSPSKTSPGKLAAALLGSGAVVGLIAVGAPKKP